MEEEHSERLGGVEGEANNEERESVRKGKGKGRESEKGKSGPDVLDLIVKEGRGKEEERKRGRWMGEVRRKKGTDETTRHDAHLPLLLQLRQREHCLLDGNIGVDSVLVVKIDLARAPTMFQVRWSPKSDPQRVKTHTVDP